MKETFVFLSSCRGIKCCIRSIVVSTQRKVPILVDQFQKKKKDLKKNIEKKEKTSEQRRVLGVFHCQTSSKQLLMSLSILGDNLSY